MVKGQLIYKNGDTYFGQLKSGGQICGQGIYKFSNGSVYEGFFQNNLFHGKGKLVDSFNSITIIGNFSKGKVQGQAKIIYEDQSIYEGQLNQGLRCGKGRYIYSDKQPQKQYNGQFYNDQYQGQGILTFKNGNYLKGTFNNSVLNGFGQYKDQNMCINGQFKNNLPHGKAKIKYFNGDFYEGNFQDGRKQGYGIYTFKDGKIYKGNFINDMRQGSGQLIFAKGSIFKGKFYKDQPIDGYYEQNGINIVGPLKQSNFNGYCAIKGQNFNISVDFQDGKKNGILSMVKKNKFNQQISFKSCFRNDKEDSASISYSQRF